MTNKITLSQDSAAVKHLCRKDKRLAKVIDDIGAIDYEPQENGFAFLTQIVVGQMLSNKVADIISRRFYSLCEGDVSSSRVMQLSEEEIRGIGISKSKAATIKLLAELVESHELDLDELSSLSDSEVLARLTSIRGIGNWTAKMYLIFVLDRPDVLPFEDGAFLQAYSWLYRTDQLKPKDVMEKCKKWKPYASAASRFLYLALDNGLTKADLFKIPYLIDTIQKRKRRTI